MMDSVLFNWNIEEFEALLDSCCRDDGVQLSLKHLRKDQRCLEAGCGTGRVVKYMTDLGYDIEGIELNPVVVQEITSRYPTLKITVGDILHIPREDNYYGGIVSYGVVEHFPEGLQRPLKEMFRVLAPGGRAIITVPSLNTLRRWKYHAGKVLNPKTNNNIRRIFGKKKLQRNKEGFKHHVFPQFGDFFEYRLSPEEFESELKKTGFQIIESVPISHMDGLYWEFGEMLCRFKNWKFYPNGLGTLVNDLLKQIPFFHNHMHACVVTKQS